MLDVVDKNKDERVDLEELHDREEASCPRTSPGCGAIPLRRLVERVARRNQICEILAWDDLTGMELAGHKVKEARGKDIQHVRDKHAWENPAQTGANRLKLGVESHHNEMDRY